MGVIVKQIEPTFWDKIYIPGLLKGLWITIKHFFSRKNTVEYPDEKHIPPIGYRGMHRLNKHPDGRIRCVACEMCASACPANAITIVPGPSPWEEGEERYPIKFEIDLLRCIYCGFCEIACPKEAIELTEIYDFVGESRQELKINKEQLLDNYEKTRDHQYYQRQMAK